MKTVQHIRLGLLVLLATSLLIAGLYFVGQQRNIFSKTITVHASFENVDGLMAGNNVRYNGYNIGMVLDVVPKSDSLIDVVFSVKESMMHCISVNAHAKLITDGLLGNMLVEIERGIPFDRPIRDGDTLMALQQPDMDEAMRTLSATNNNLLSISSDLKHISGRFLLDNSLWQLLADTALSPQVRSTVYNIDRVADRAALIGGNLNEILQHVRQGRGTMGALVYDTSIYASLRNTIGNAEILSDTLQAVSGNLLEFSGKVTRGRGNVAAFVNDSLFVDNLDSSAIEITNAARLLNETLLLLRESRLLKRYERRRGKR
jgi:phospholipid/cholesterol/gamma-HCH transport system substrate-binding protein